METIESYRRLAREAMARSRETMDTLRRSEWLEIAGSWERVASEQTQPPSSAVPTSDAA